MCSYVGITIGPIFDTICDADSPAALWFASSLFSDITRRLCKAISDEENGFLNAKIYSPSYSKDINLEDGVGKFHDRIVFSADSIDTENLKKIIESVKEDTVLCFTNEFDTVENREFFKNYLQIHYVISSEDMKNEKCVLKLSKYLDALELMKNFPTNDLVNPIRKLNLGEPSSRNKTIKETSLFTRISDENNYFINEKGNFKSIEEIAMSNNSNKDLKKSYYYAVVYADGDGMGKFLEKISSDEVIKFSEKCLDYDEQAANLIHEYGGMTIYAGGDDLLFLAPVTTDKKSVFEICFEIQELFKEKMEKEFGKLEDSIPTISFGISIQYKNYPLYEALNSARDLLDLVKKDSKKDAMAIKLQKHSGQSLALMVGNQQYEVFKEFLNAEDNLEKKDEVLNAEDNLEKKDEVINSILFILGNHYAAIEVLNKSAKANEITLESYQKRWENFFDNKGQSKAKTYINKISELYYTHMVTNAENRIFVPKDYLEEVECSLQTLLYLLRLKHFLVEKGGDEK